MQALGKSCKMVPVMLMGVLIRRRRYPLHQYIIVLSITAGILGEMCTQFSLCCLRAAVLCALHGSAPGSPNPSWPCLAPCAPVFNLFKGKGEDGGSNSTFGLVLLLLSLVLDGVTGPLQVRCCHMLVWVPA